MLYIDQKYVNLISSRLPRFKKKSDKLWVARCVFCGDSKKDKSKTRLYLYVNKDRISIKCHNCDYSTSLFGLLKFIDPSIANAYKLETFAQNGTNNVGPTDSAVLGQTQERHPAPDPGDDALLKLGFKRISNLDPSEFARAYINSRKIPKTRWLDIYYSEDYSKLAELVPAYEGRLAREARIVIPFHDQNGSLTGVAGRAIGNNPKRYLNVRIGPAESPMIYGLKHIDATRPIYVVEGAFDSMFVDNAIAVGGSDLSKALNLFRKDQLILVFDNEPRNKDIVKIMEKMVSYGYKMVIWPTDWKFKDINEAVIGGVTTEQIAEVLHTNTHHGLALNLAIRNWKR